METTSGGTRWPRFVAVAVPAALAALTMIPAIAFGWITIGITSATPIVVHTSGGTSDSLTLVTGNDGRLTALAPTGSGEAAPLVELSDTRLEDLCLVPTVELPLLGAVFSVKVMTGRPVDIGRITLTTTDVAAAGVRLPRTTLGYVNDPNVAGAPQGSTLVLGTEAAPSATSLSDADLGVYGMEVSDGFLVRSLRINAGTDDLAC